MPGKGDNAFAAVLAALFWVSAVGCAIAAKLLHRSHLHTLRAYSYGAVAASMLAAAAGAFWTALLAGGKTGEAAGGSR